MTLDVKQAWTDFLAAENGTVDQLAEWANKHGQGVMLHIDELHHALKQSVQLQSHYATLLNGWDGGKRMTFADGNAWMKRLACLK